MSASRANKRSWGSDVAKGRDRISNLPESVICHILSRLTTKQAVRTCVLSRNWEHKWTFIFNINIDDNELHLWDKKRNFFNLRSTKTNFCNFVERVLFVSLNAKTFRLRCNEEYESSCVTSWVSTILRRKVENLEVIYDHEGVVLPQRLLSCTSLKELKLKLQCTLKVPVKSSLPRLTVLCLDKVKIQNENPQTDTLRFKFPSLKTFELRECTWLDVKSVDIYAPKLTTLTCKSSLHAEENEYSVKITAEKVENFNSSGGVPGNVTVTGSLTYATLEHVFDTSDLQLLKKAGSLFCKLWKGLSSSKHLVLSGCLAKAIGHSEREDPLPAFSNLQRLAIPSTPNAEGLIALLHCTIRLKYLEANVQSWDDYDYEQVKPLPYSLLVHLEEVKFENFTGTTPQLNLAKFVLENGPKLKKLLSPAPNLEKDGVEEQNPLFLWHAAIRV